jgi:tRNA-2-methylthio-N6-dimethylallyladenosine synthase
MTKPKRVYIETYGCQMNLSDTELMFGVLAAHGYEPTDRPEEADVVLVNTCAIRDHAEQRVLGRVGQLQALRRHNPKVIIGVTGCMAQRMGEDLLRRSGGVDLVVGPDGYRSLPERIEEVRLGRRPSATGRPRGGLAVLDFDPFENYEGIVPRRTTPYTAWVPIQRGCNHRCTFCIVPYVRGPEKNRAPERILEEVRRLVAEGVVEVTLLGQTVNSYRYGDWDFPRLLRAVARVEGLRRVRFTSPHPNDFTRELAAVMAEEPTVCKQLHLPLQAGHDRTLKRMLRRYTVAEYKEKVAWAREAMPDLALSTDIIVAFPGETEEEFEATVALLEEIRFDDAFLYKYSPRPGTPTTRLPRDQWIAPKEAQRRLERVIEVQRRIQLERFRGRLGQVAEVLVEGEGKRGGLQGRTDGNFVVIFPGPTELVGRFVRVRLMETSGATFRGELVEASARAA